MRPSCPSRRPPGGCPAGARWSAGPRRAAARRPGSGRLRASRPPPVERRARSSCLPSSPPSRVVLPLGRELVRIEPEIGGGPPQEGTPDLGLGEPPDAQPALLGRHPLERTEQLVHEQAVLSGDP